MLGFIVSQLRFRRGRVAALGLGILVTAVSFTLLLSAAETSELRVRRVVAENFRPAYDILVRPEDSFTSLEKERGLVQQNYLSGIFGGISLKQYRNIEDIAGVQLAAPIANIGYIMPFKRLNIDIEQQLNGDPTQFYRLRPRWIAHGGSSRYPTGEKYVYYTETHPILKRDLNYQNSSPCTGYGRSAPVVGAQAPFNLTGSSYLTCFSSLSPGAARRLGFGFPRGYVGNAEYPHFPVLIAAIDPVAERKLLHLDHAMVSGRYLPNDRGLIRKQVKDVFGGNVDLKFVPVIASTKTFVKEALEVDVQRLAIPEQAQLEKKLSSSRAYRFVRTLQGRTVAKLRYPIGPFYESMIDRYSGPSPDASFANYWTTAPVRYRTEDGRIFPLPVNNPRSVFSSGYYGGGWAPQQNRDLQFRRLKAHEGSPDSQPSIKVLGRFDPSRLPGFSPLSKVPLETYYPPRLEPADATSKEALNGHPLLPGQNLGDYVSQPPFMLTTLRGLKGFTNPAHFSDASDKAPISVIRIRVAGVKGPDPLSRERIRRVAQEIHRLTGLAVDITAGSSPRDVVVELPAGKFGRPALTLKEGWVEKGVAIKFLKAVDEKSLTLFVLILVTCGFFLANGAFAAARSRRREIGTLSCLGWSKAKIFTAVLGELAVTGIVAGILGALVAVITVQALSLTMSLARILLVVPVALLLAVTAGIIPAYRAARTRPIEVVTHSTTEARRGRSARHTYTMAMAGLRRRPSRTLLGVLGLAVGVASLALLLAVNDAFHGVLVGNLMGEFISIEIKGVDYLSVGLVIFLGGVSIADVLYLNLKERAPELVTLKTVGWRGSHLVRLIAAEGLWMGALGSLLGAGLALGLSNLIPQLPTASIVLAVALAGAAGIAVAALAALFPVAKISGLTPPTVLAEE